MFAFVVGNGVMVGGQVQDLREIRYNDLRVQTNDI